MDAVEFLRDYKAMCESYPTCEGCRLYDPPEDEDRGCWPYALAHPAAVINVVGRWIEDHKGVTIRDTPDQPDQPTPSVSVGRGDILDKARACVCQDRNREYGEPEDGFRLIAALWEPVIRESCVSPGADVSVNPETVALLMALLKAARAVQNPGHLDSWIDMAGYAACGGEIACKENNNG